MLLDQWLLRLRKQLTHKEWVIPLSVLDEWMYFIEMPGLPESGKEERYRYILNRLANDVFCEGYSLCINNDNFWNYESNTPYPITIEAIKFFRPFISSLNLHDIELSDEDLSYFKDIKHMKSLRLTRCHQLTGSGFKYLTSAIETIEELLIWGDSLKDESFFVFKPATNVKVLTIAILTGSCAILGHFNLYRKNYSREDLSTITPIIALEIHNFICSR